MFNHDTKITVDHLVVFERENTIFVCAKENNRARIFLVYDNGNGQVLVRNGRAQNWEPLEAEDDASFVRATVAAARSSHVPTYSSSGYYA